MDEICSMETIDNTKYRLLPSLMAARLGKHFYLYDQNATVASVIFIPPQKVPRRAYDVIQRLKEVNPGLEPWSIKKIKEIFHDPKDISAIDVLLRNGYIEEYKSPPVSSVPDADLSESPSTQKTALYQEAFSKLIQDFHNRETKHFFNKPRFFNVPDEIGDNNVDVGIVGVPFSTVPDSMGTISTPLYLRMLTQRCGIWFDIYKKGIFSEINMDDTMPSILCREVMLKDYGDLGANTRTVADLFMEIQGFIKETVIPYHIRPIFVGGDHAITFPIVDTFIKHYSDLCLIHLDAHSDLFYSEQILFNHGAPISNLLLYSGLSHVYSFGLRKEYRSHIENVTRITQHKQLADRVHLFSIGAFKRLLADRRRFEKVINRLLNKDTPCYLSIDLDVLSPHVIANQLSTPCGAGLEWWELYEAISLILSRLNVVACDVVEFNLEKKNQADDPKQLPFLFLLLIDGLSHYRLKEI